VSGLNRGSPLFFHSPCKCTFMFTCLYLSAKINWWLMGGWNCTNNGINPGPQFNSCNHWNLCPVSIQRHGTVVTNHTKTLIIIGISSSLIARVAAMYENTRPVTLLRVEHRSTPKISTLWRIMPNWLLCA